ncbi:MAG: hypothetical protein J0H32_02325, partial [Rhizobiales bacterium]|nr:hypothetical protein [Hyphomicrobiales bacterium]
MLPKRLFVHRDQGRQFRHAEGGPVFEGHENGRGKLLHHGLGSAVSPVRRAPAAGAKGLGAEEAAAAGSS